MLKPSLSKAVGWGSLHVWQRSALERSVRMWNPQLFPLDRGLIDPRFPCGFAVFPKLPKS